MHPSRTLHRCSRRLSAGGNACRTRTAGHAQRDVGADSVRPGREVAHGADDGGHPALHEGGCGADHDRTAAEPQGTRLTGVAPGYQGRRSTVVYLLPRAHHHHHHSDVLTLLKQNPILQNQNADYLTCDQALYCNHSVTSISSVLGEPNDVRFL